MEKVKERRLIGMLRMFYKRYNAYKEVERTGTQREKELAKSRYESYKDCIERTANILKKPNDSLASFLKKNKIIIK